MKSFLNTINFGAREIQALLLTNLLLIVLAIALHWNVGELMLLFWIENIIIGFYGILRIIFFQGRPGEDEIEINQHQMKKQQLKGILVPFFILHFGFFCFIHASFIEAFFGGEFIGKPNHLLSWQSIWSLKFGIFAIFFSYGVDFIARYILKKERETVSFQELLIGPYRRIFVIQILLMAAGILFILFLSKVPAFVYIVLFFGMRAFVELHQQKKSSTLNDKPE